MKRRIAALLVVAAVGWPACERTAVAASGDVAVVSAADATIIVAVISSITTVVMFVLHRHAERSRKALRSEFQAVRAENTEQHAAGQQLLRTLVDSHHHLGDKVDGIGRKVDDVGSKLDAHIATNHQPSGEPS